MRLSKALAAMGTVLLCLYLAGLTPLKEHFYQRVEAGRMKNVTLVSDIMPSPTPMPLPSPAPEEVLMPIPEPTAEAMAFSALEDMPEILETTIQGGLSIKNETSLSVDVPSLLLAGREKRLSPEGVQVLIIHTHGSEAYTPAGLDRYEATDPNRTEDTAYNVVRVGDELAEIYSAAGLSVIHDRNIYDHPSYTGSYTRSGKAVEEYLRQYPEIGIVIDLHRDALGAGDVIYKTMAEEEGVCASQIMLLSGSNDSGLEHPHWRDNLALAFYLQEAVSARHPTLMRPVSLVRERYNQHLSPGSLILEVGCSGNTLQEALAAIRLFGEASATALLELVEE